MKQILGALLLLFLTGACTNKDEVTEGKVYYEIDYPNHKDNFFLYSILPKEMEVDFKDGKIKSLIRKANLKNALLVDCNKKQVSAYFSYGDEAFHVELLQQDIGMMLKDQKEYSIRFTDEKDTMAGFNVKKAVATCKTDPSDKIDLWYTEEIRLPHSNWYNPFKEIPGFLMAYSIDRYGIRMDFKATKFEEVEINDSEMQPIKSGISILYTDYNAKLADLFKSFE